MAVGLPLTRGVPSLNLLAPTSGESMSATAAQFTGEPGVCLATSGPGAIHLLNGLYDAKLDHQPVVAIIGQQSSTSLGGHYQQEVDLASLFKDVASEYVTMVTHPSAVRHAVDRAVRIARYERTVTCVILPNDVQEQPYQKPERAHGTLHSIVGYSVPRVLPQDADLRRAADVLNSGKKVAMLVGAGAMNASDEVVQVADVLGAGVAKALLGKAVLPDEFPLVTGTIGLLGTKPSWDLMADCDTLLMVGTSVPYSEFLPREGQARGVQIDIDGRMLAIRYPMEVPLVGDSRETLRALLPLLQRKQDRGWRETVERGVRQWWKQAEALAMTAADPVSPRRVFWELSPRIPDEAILTADSGSGTLWYAQNIKVRKGMMASLSGNLATMPRPCSRATWTRAASSSSPSREWWSSSCRTRVTRKGGHPRRGGVDGPVRRWRERASSGERPGYFAFSSYSPPG